MIEILILLIAAHALCDYPLQGDFVAKFKSPSAPPINGENIWKIIMGAHVSIHAGAVLLITGMWPLAIAEACIHWITDKAKCEQKISFVKDQAIHVCCKIAWTIIWAILSGTTQ